jgi:hypothetical protein
MVLSEALHFDNRSGMRTLITPMNLIAITVECAKCRKEIALTFTSTAVKPGYQATWTCPCCLAEHSLGLIGQIVSVQPAKRTTPDREP